LFNPSSGDHFYTVDHQEAITAATSGGYVREGVAGWIYSLNFLNRCSKLYRLYNGSWGPDNNSFWNDALSWAKIVGEGLSCASSIYGSGVGGALACGPVVVDLSGQLK
jgi:hypothetical protein